MYFVLTSSNINETSGFCTKYCGFHTHATLNGADIKYAFVGNPDRCPCGCEIQTTGPNSPSTGVGGADGMINVLSHEQFEAITDPDLNAWFDASGNEDSDKCNFNFGAVITCNPTALARLPAPLPLPSTIRLLAVMTGCCSSSGKMQPAAPACSTCKN